MLYVLKTARIQTSSSSSLHLCVIFRQYKTSLIVSRSIYTDGDETLCATTMAPKSQHYMYSQSSIHYIHICEFMTLRRMVNCFLARHMANGSNTIEIMVF